METVNSKHHQEMEDLQKKMQEELDSLNTEKSSLKKEISALIAKIDTLQ
jgi:peptidoglycan hydrolase CwlO-like protein